MLLAEAARHRSITVPREMLRRSGYRTWRGDGKPPKKWNPKKHCGKWIAWFSESGPVERSCSIQAITEGKLKSPAKIGTELFVYMGGCMADFRIAVQVWKVVPASEFVGQTWTYSEKLAYDRGDEDKCGGEYARNDPNGFYHGMTGKMGKSPVVLQGPPVYLLPEARKPKEAKPKQTSLF